MSPNLLQPTLDRHLGLSKKTVTVKNPLPPKISKRRKYRSQNRILRRSVAVLSYQNNLLRNRILQDVTNQFQILSFTQIQQSHRNQPPPIQQQQPPQQPTQQQEVVNQQQQPPQQPTQQQVVVNQQQQSPQQPIYETLGAEEYVIFTPPHQTEQIQVLTTTPPSNLQTAELYSEIENTDFDTFFRNLSCD